MGGTDHGRGDERALPGQQGLGGIDPEEQWFWDLCGMWERTPRPAVTTDDPCFRLPNSAAAADTDLSCVE